MSSNAVIFDMDGVLVRTLAAHFEAWETVMRRFGLEVTEAQFGPTIGRTGRDIIADLWPGRFTVEEAAAIDAEKEATYRRTLEARFAEFEMPGAGKLIASLHEAGFRMAIGSSGPAENVAVVKGKITNGNLIEATVNGFEVKEGKPHPDVFLAAAGKLDVLPVNCAVIEDAVVGIEAARRAGMAAIGLTGTAAREALAARAHVVVDSLDELSPAYIASVIREAEKSNRPLR